MKTVTPTDDHKKRICEIAGVLYKPKKDCNKCHVTDLMMCSIEGENCEGTDITYETIHKCRERINEQGKWGIILMVSAIECINEKTGDRKYYYHKKIDTYDKPEYGSELSALTACIIDILDKEV